MDIGIDIDTNIDIDIDIDKDIDIDAYLNTHIMRTHNIVVTGLGPGI